MRTQIVSPDHAIRIAAALVGGALLVEAARDASAAGLHMAIIGSLCGASPLAPHCGWCYAAASLGLAGLAVLLFAIRPRTASADSDLSRVNAEA